MDELVEQAVERARRSTLVLESDQLPKGHVRFETSLRYPDGSSIDVFLERPPPLMPLFPSKVTDFGQTIGWLLNAQVRPWQSKKRQAFLNDTLRLYGASLNGAAIEKAVEGPQDVADAVVQIAQAAFRASDLAFTRRASLQSTVSEDVEELLGDLEVEYSPDFTLEIEPGRVVRVDFLVRRPIRDAAILTLSTGSTTQAHATATEIFARFYDLQHSPRNEDRLTVFDDRYDVYRDQDLGRLRDVSDVVPLSDHITLGALLKAA